MTGTALHAARRARELDGLAGRTLDLLVVGGGVTGAGVALDAAARGLDVALVEARDLAFGTSRWSSKLVHGGLRYLATGDLTVARESARERHLLMTRTAPHLVRALPQVAPFVPSLSGAQRVSTRVGFALGDHLRWTAGTPASVLPRPRRVTSEAVLRLAPATARTGLAGGMLGYDGQLVDDARLVVALARTAAGLGASVLTRVRAERVTGDGADLVDGVTGARLAVRARAVVNASGVWAGTVDPSVRLRPSRGTHLVLPAGLLGDPSAALMAALPGSTSRFVFALPQQLGRVVVGLTDEEAPGPVPDVPEPTPGEVAFLLTTISRVLERDLAPDDVLGAFAGLRPLVDTGDGATADLSRKHHVGVSASGVVNVLGGKLTTYRAMAQGAVDAAVAHSGLAAGPCRTASLPLVGAGSVPDGAALAPGALGTWLVARHGTEATRVLADAVQPGARDAVGHGLDLTRAEIEWAVTHEGALDADDVLDRRTRIGLVPADRERVRNVVEELVGGTLARLGS
ncbi:glycerol-3-phosphate dehydrogenase/oxidase [Antribacter gilvus]|uniref:glycerol-3-phosphate dehydrogenase/oxidase n=1 Tax=Antribacter gilvus TaxID=2304675 RepID=UPI000F794FAB|nr:glycerol-3-phosphate dehydrogenase/oxidase [Antribacter gilvus]